jgi:hypothetical protein
MPTGKVPYQLHAHIHTHTTYTPSYSVPSIVISACRNLKIGYFSQHHVEQLDLNVSAVELLARKFPGVLGIGIEARVPALESV